MSHPDDPFIRQLTPSPDVIVEREGNVTEVVISTGLFSADDVLLVQPDVYEVELAEIGPQGPPGPAGPTGPTGPQGVPGSVDGALPQFIHDQAIPAATWYIVHNLNRLPAVTVLDSADTEVVGNVDYIDLNTIELTFSAPFGGRAIIGG